MRLYTLQDKAEYAEGLLYLMLDMSVCNASHAEISWESAALLMRRGDFASATQLYIQGYTGGYASTAELFQVGQQLQAVAGGGGSGSGMGVGVVEVTEESRARVESSSVGMGAGRAGGKEEKNGGDDGDGGGGGDNDQYVQCLEDAQTLYRLVMEHDSLHAECSLQLATVTYRLLLHQDTVVTAAACAAAAAAAASPGTSTSSPGALSSIKKNATPLHGSRSSKSSRSSRQREVEGTWGQVVGWLRHAVECSGVSINMHDRVFTLGLLLEDEGHAGDAATVMSLVVELSNNTHAGALLKSASLLHHCLEDLDGAADMYACAVRVGAANVDMLFDYAQVSFPFHRRVHLLLCHALSVRLLMPMQTQAHACTHTRIFSTPMLTCTDLHTFAAAGISRLGYKCCTRVLQGSRTI